MSATLPTSVSPNSVANADQASHTFLMQSLRHGKRLLRRFIMSAVVWMFYVPHLSIIRLLGPRLGLRWVRGIARLHWLLTYVGAQRAVRSTLEALQPKFDTKLSVSAILRKHLELKHEYFARVKLFEPSRKSGWCDDAGWEISPAVIDQIKRMRADGKSLILVGYHFGFFRLMGMALSRMHPGCDSIHVSHRTAHYAGDTTETVARLAMRRAFDADQHSGARVHYVDSNASVLRLVRILKAGDTIALGADGAFSTDFVDVPFMGGKLRLPSGWARLAGAMRSNVLILADADMNGRREVLAFDHIQVADTSTESIFRAVAAAALILEQLVSKHPWEWHPWQRIKCEIANDGSTLFALAELGTQNMCPDTSSPNAKLGFRPRKTIRMQDPGIDTNAVATGQTNLSSPVPAGSSHAKPRVAILTNSFTPYRVFLHERIVREIPEIELWSLATHSNSFQRWDTLKVPAAIRPIDFGPGQPTNQQTKLRFCGREWRKARRVIRWLKINNVSAVFCQGCGDVGRLRILHWCRQHGVPCYLTGDCNIRGDYQSGLRRVIKRIVFRKAVEWSYGVMPCGVYGRAYFERYGAANKPFSFFPFIPDIELFQRPNTESADRWSRELNAQGRRRRVLFCGRLVQAKRPDLAIQAFATVAQERPEWDLVMAGDGILRKTLEAQLPPHLTQRIIWISFVHNIADLAGLYSQCDVLLLPSDHEPWGVVIVEAAAAGLAIVSSDVVGASPELVRPNRNGAIFPAGDLDALVQSLKQVTASNHIDSLKEASPAVLREWLDYADPVKNLREVLMASGIACRNCRCEKNLRTAIPPIDALSR